MKKALRCHRDAPKVPTRAKTRRDRMAWLKAHRLWKYPASYRSVVDGGEVVEHEFLDGGWTECIEFDFQSVDPTTRQIESPAKRNTLGEVWLEAGGWSDMSKDPHCAEPMGGWNQYNQWIRCNNWSLACGATDMESALLELASRVEFYYGDGFVYREGVPDRCEGHSEGETWVYPCADAGDGYCQTCGYPVKDD